MTPKTYEENELRERLTPEQFAVTQQAGTEQAFTGCYWDTKIPGTYHCIVCDKELFESDAKYNSGTGWPSFFRAIDEDRVKRVTDSSLGINRVETACGNCEAHLGHVFPDGPPPTGERFCINSASLRLDSQHETEKE